MSKGDKKRLQKRVQELESDVEKQSNERVSLETQITSQTKRADTAVQQNKGLQEDNSGLMAQLEELREKVNDLTDEKVNLTEDRDRLKSERVSLEVSLSLE